MQISINFPTISKQSQQKFEMFAFAWDAARESALKTARESSECRSTQSTKLSMKSPQCRSRSREDSQQPSDVSSSLALRSGLSFPSINTLNNTERVHEWDFTKMDEKPQI